MVVRPFDRRLGPGLLAGLHVHRGERTHRHLGDGERHGGAAEEEGGQGYHVEK
jgi:hypothetical protein